MAVKRLFRSETDKAVSGVLAGIGEYLDVDPVLLRLFYVAVTIFTGVLPGILVYILAIFIVPIRKHAIHVDYDVPPHAHTQPHAATSHAEAPSH